MTNFLRIFLISFIFAYNGGLLNALLPPESSIHTAQLVLGLTGMMIGFRIKEFVKIISLNNNIIFLFALLIIYFLINRSSLTPEYAQYKIELLLWNFFAMIIIIVGIKSYREIKYIILLGVFQIAIGILLEGLDFSSYRTGAGDPIVSGRLGGIVLCFGLFFADRKLLILRIFFGVLGFIFILLSGTRTIYIAFAFICVLFLFLDPNTGQFKIKRNIGKTFIGYIIGVIVLITIINLNFFKINPAVIERFSEAFVSLGNFSSHDGSTAERVLEWSIALNVWKENLFFGDGLGSYGYHWFKTDARMYPHNLILELLAEGGVVALFIFAKIVLLTWRKLKKNLPYSPYSLNKFLIGLFFLGLTTSLTSLELPNQFIFFLSLSLILSLNAITHKDLTT
jgi:O-antigen ligase